MTRKLIETFGVDRAAPLMVAKVYRDTADTYGYVVRFFKDGTKYRPEADYETNDREDALATAKHAVDQAHQPR